ncbi:MAG TPA: thiol:disulfide interchange protein DsbA/DsbL [Rudaea sp.]|nr:thiol:disulfide interchange protein DsbA/DsbL [Rudaea sp.]
MRVSAVLLGLVFAGSAVAAPAPAVPSPYVAGTDYFLIDPPQRSGVDDKIEVTEVFSYGCPACNFAYPYFEKIRKGLPSNAVMTYVPASFKPNEDWPMFQRAYLAAQVLGIADKAHAAMFDAIWKDKTLAIMNPDGRTIKSPLPTIEDAAQFYAKFGVKPEDFVATANSFAINTKMKQADAYVHNTGVDSTPTIVVAGKYRLTFQSAGGDWDRMGQLINYLVRKETAEK